MATDWFYKVGELESGALTEGQLRQMIIERRIGRETPVRKGTAGRWTPAGSVPGLSLPDGDNRIAQQGNTTARKVTCACGKRLTIKDSYVGKKVKCTACGEPILLDLSLRMIEAIAALPEASLQSRRQRWSFAATVIPIILIAGVAGLAIYLPSIYRQNSAKPGGRAEGAVEGRKPRELEIDNREKRADDRELAFGEDGGNQRFEQDHNQPPKQPARAAGRAFLNQNVEAAKPRNGKPAGERNKPGVNNAEKADADLVARGIGQLADLIEVAERCVVRLDVSLDGGAAIGSGFVVDKGGTIITNYHVVQGAKSITARFNDDLTLKIAGYTLVVPAKDLAVLQIVEPNNPLPYLRVADKPPRKGDSVVAFGSPRGLSFSASEGIVSGIRSGRELAAFGDEKSGKWIQTTAPISHGNSGGPLVNLAGDVVGVNTMALVGSQNLNFAISAEDVRSAIDDAKGLQVVDLSPERLPPPPVKNAIPNFPPDPDGIPPAEIHLDKSRLSPTERTRLKSLAETVWFGVIWRDLLKTDPRVVRQLGSSAGALVLEVANRSPAYKAGIIKGDVIRSIDGKLATQTSTIEATVEASKPGQTVTMILMRPVGNPVQYIRKEVKVTLESSVPHYAIEPLADAETPVEVRDFLARQVLRYAVMLAEAIGASSEANSGLVSRVPSKPKVMAAHSAFSVKELRDKDVFDETFRPAFGRDVPVHVGNIGILHRSKVLIILDRNKAVLHVPPAFVMLKADTANLIEGELADIGTAQVIQAIEVAFSNSGDLFKLFVAKPFAVEKYLPHPGEDAVENKGEEAGTDNEENRPAGAKGPQRSDKLSDLSKVAEGKLKMAKDFIQKGEDEVAKRRLKELIEKHPGTSAAKEAKMLLKAMK